METPEQNYGGGFVYVRKADTIMKSSRNIEICEKFNGYNFRELAKEYNLSEKMIRKIVSDKLQIMKNMPMDGQLSFE